MRDPTDTATRRSHGRPRAWPDPRSVCRAGSFLLPGSANSPRAISTTTVPVPNASTQCRMRYRTQANPSASSSFPFTVEPPRSRSGSSVSALAVFSATTPSGDLIAGVDCDSLSLPQRRRRQAPRDLPLRRRAQHRHFSSLRRIPLEKEISSASPADRLCSHSPVISFESNFDPIATLTPPSVPHRFRRTADRRRSKPRSAPSAGSDTTKFPNHHSQPPWRSPSPESTANHPFPRSGATLHRLRLPPGPPLSPPTLDLSLSRKYTVSLG